jgi:outer membrane protein OmpA-like peptidoglycan-associated protein
MIRHRLLRWLSATLVSVAMGGPALAAYTDPDAPETEAAARAALPNAIVRDIAATVLDIPGLSRDVTDRGRGIEGRVQELDKANKDLNAKQTDLEIRILLPADVLFDFDKANIRPDAHAALRSVAVILSAYSKSPVLIEGHTDAKGRDAYNQKLSEQRAASVKAWLVKEAGIEAARMTTRGWGKQRPVAPNTKPDGKDDPAGRQKNRRVEIVVQKR